MYTGDEDRSVRSVVRYIQVIRIAVRPIVRYIQVIRVTVSGL